VKSNREGAMRAERKAIATGFSFALLTTGEPQGGGGDAYEARKGSVEHTKEFLTLAIAKQGKIVVEADGLASE
jgi:hypothetical protein